MLERESGAYRPRHKGGVGLPAVPSNRLPQQTPAAREKDYGWNDELADAGQSDGVDFARLTTTDQDDQDKHNSPDGPQDGHANNRKPDKNKAATTVADTQRKPKVPKRDLDGDWKDTRAAGNATVHGGYAHPSNDRPKKTRVGQLKPDNSKSYKKASSNFSSGSKQSQHKQTVIGSNGVGTKNNGRVVYNKIYIIALKDQVTGVLVWYPDPHPYVPFDGENPKLIFERPDGTFWYDKGRFLIILLTAAGNCCDAPIYSYGNTGLENRSNKDEYLNLRLPGRKTYTKQSPNMPTLEVAELTGAPFTPDRDTMVVHLAGYAKRDYDQKNIVKAGKLTPKSCAILLQEYLKWTEKQVKKQMAAIPF